MVSSDDENYVSSSQKGFAEKFQCLNGIMVSSDVCTWRRAGHIIGGFNA